MNPPPRRLYEVRPVRVMATERGLPTAVEGIPVETVREEWLVEDRWWTTRPLWRHYFELLLADGRNVVVFHSADGWHAQRA
jgi:hypothetical protein